MTSDEIGEQLERFHERSFGWALACCDRDRDEALDVLQTAYEKILSGRARYGGKSTFVTWLFAVIRKTAAQHRRSQRLRSFVLLGRTVAHPVEPVEPGQLNCLVQEDERARLIKVLRELPARQREVLHLVFYQDMTIAESAEVLAIGVGTARTHYERAKTALRAKLARATGA